MRACSGQLRFLFHDKDWDAEPSESTRFDERLLSTGRFVSPKRPSGGTSKLVLEISSTLDLIDYLRFRQESLEPANVR